MKYKFLWAYFSSTKKAQPCDVLVITIPTGTGTVTREFSIFNLLYIYNVHKYVSILLSQPPVKLKKGRSDMAWQNLELRATYNKA